MRSILLSLALWGGLMAHAAPVYVCGRTSKAPCIDGKGDDPVWQQARELSPLRDICGGSIPHQCRIRMLWDDSYLYILADMDEEHLRASKTEHDSIIYHDPDFEVFIDPDGDGLNYIELEINALNTTWDLFIARPYRFNDPHILHDWDIPGLRHAVHLRGTLNDASDTDDGWSVELAIPWSSITSHDRLPRCNQAPEPGSSMRMNFSRVNWQVEPTAEGYKALPVPESNHVWAPTGKVNIHLPEHWGRVVFSPHPAHEWVAAPPPAGESARLKLYGVLNAQLEYRNRQGSFHPQPALPEGVAVAFPTDDFFVLSTTCPQSGIRMRLDSEGRFAATAPAQPLPEFYLWVHGKQERSDTEWKERFKNYAEAGIGTLIIDGSTDCIARLTPIAKAAGLRVFAWFWVLNRPGDTVAMQNPEWYAVNALGKSCHLPQNRPYVEYYQFLCPNNRDVQRYLLEQIRQLATLPGLDGIQLDYMRLPDRELPRGLWGKYRLDMSQANPAFDYCYCPRCRESFAHETQHRDWQEFRAHSIAGLFNALAAEIRSHGLLAACAVFPSPRLATRLVHQDWSLFHADLALPMAYHVFYDEPSSWAASITRRAMQETQGRLPLAPGVHLPDIPPSELIPHLESLHRTGIHGIALFSDEELMPEHIEQLKAYRAQCQQPAPATSNPGFGDMSHCFIDKASD